MRVVRRATLIPPATSVGLISPAAWMASNASTITDDGTHKSEHRAEGDEQANPCQSRLHLAGLYGSVGNDGFFNRVETLVVAVEALIVDRSDRATGVAANLFGSLDAAILQGLFDLGDEFLRVDRRERQVKDTFDGYSQTEYEEYQNRKHPLPTAFEELLHHDVVQAVRQRSGFRLQPFQRLLRRPERRH